VFHNFLFFSLFRFFSFVISSRFR